MKKRALAVVISSFVLTGLLYYNNVHDFDESLQILNSVFEQETTIPIEFLNKKVPYIFSNTKTIPPQCAFIKRYNPLATRSVTYTCPKRKNCGGLADRILAITSLFAYAIVSGRSFHIDWTRPTNIKDSLEPRLFHNLYSTPENAAEYDLINAHARRLAVTFGNATWFQEDHVRVALNRGFLYNVVAAQGALPDEHSLFACAFFALFKPANRITRILSQSYPVLKNSVGLQIRTGDTELRNGRNNPSARFDTRQMSDSMLLGKVRDLTDCARELGRKVFAVTDSPRLRALLPEFYHSGLPIGHVHYAKVQDYASQLIITDSAIAELFMLSMTKTQVISPSGFGKVAYFLSKFSNDKKVVLLTPQTNPALHKLKPRHKTGNCAKDQSLWIDRQKLIHEWSLG